MSLLVLATFVMSACSTSTSHSSPAQSQTQIATQAAEMPPEQAQEAMNELGKNFLYGDGLGNTILNVGTTVMFPPYAVFLLGNFALSASGYQPLGVSSFLEEDAQDSWNKSYSTVVSGPGRLAASISGEEYRSPEQSKKKLEKYIALGETDGIHGEY